MPAREVSQPATERADPLAIDYIFRPRAVAVVGVSPPQWGPADVAAGFLVALQDIKFEGPIYPVNPHHEEILGLKCYPSLLEIPGPVDHVIFSVPTKAVPHVFEECVAKGVKTIHFFTSGFSETGEAEGAELERRIAARAREVGIRLIGPNCMGLYCPSSKLAAMPGSPVEPGPVGFLSQSGGNTGDVIFTAAPRGIRFSKVVSYGNASDLNEIDFLEYLAADPETEIIIAYIEGVRDGRRFFDALRHASARKPVIVLKGGRTEGGERAVFSHTASLAGSARVFDAALRQAGAVRVDSVDELVDLTVAFRFTEPPQGRGAAVVGPGGGFSVFAADEVNEAGLALPELSFAVQQELRSFTPTAGTSVRNPVDTNIIMEFNKLTDTLRIVASDPNVDVVLFHIGFGWGSGQRGLQQNDRPLPFDPAMIMKALTDAIVQAKETAAAPIVLVVRTALDKLSRRFSSVFQEQCASRGLPVFPTIPRACNAVAKMVRWWEMRQDA